ncbi:ubiquitin carboxyl-terminal hydrolase 8 [Chelonus insularis]|uniref:ubiquitin carboxyl-terminal hydrolase 8 n=1 Tax=Chelonus insularis TaxID=460826 RepID=UPI001589ACFA|nr:ubiquitin carboxyl-terminal hydrolase 8 [Chelonus insularis]
MVNYPKETITDFDYLNQKSVFDTVNKKPRKVVERLPKLHEAGVSNYKQHKYDFAYINFTKYLKIVEWLKKCNEYKIDSSFFNKSIPNSKIEEAKAILQKVIEHINNEIEKNKVESTIDKIVAVKNNNRVKNNQADDEAFLDMALNLPETPTDDPLNKPNDELDGFILCTQLFTHVQNKRTLIIDIRSAKDYEHSRIKAPACINLPASEIKTGLIARKFESYLSRDSEACSLFTKRSTAHVDRIILLDWSTNHKSLDSSNKLTILKDILDKWDPGIVKPKPLILEGGFKEWINVYPTYVTNPNVTLPSTKSEEDSMIEILEEISYPEWIPGDDKLIFKFDEVVNQKNGVGIMEQISQEINSINLKPDSIKNSPKSVPKIIQKPVIDRSNKPTIKSQEQVFIELLQKLIETDEDQEKFEKQLLDFDMADDQDLRLVEDYDTIESKKNAVQETLQKTLMDKDAVKQKITEIKKLGVLNTPEIDNLWLKYLNIENHITNIRVERKAVKQKKLEEAAKRNALCSQKFNNNLIFKEPLKSEGFSMNSDLKRSLSSPNLAKIDDKKKPVVDRSSKPTDLYKKQEINNVNNNNYSITSWRDHVKRMDPVYRDVHPGITGLKNLGNSCYMNSIIQCLSNTPFLSKYFIDNAYKDDLNTNRNSETDGRVAEEFAHVIKALWRGQYRSIAPRDFKDTIGSFKYQFDTTDQQDSHEFLTFFLEWMHNDLRKKDNKIQIENLLSPAEKEWWKALEGQTSIISKLFIGQLKSTISCKVCGSRSITYETFNSLSISLPGSSRCTLNECIQHFLSRQVISGWACPNCKKPRDAEKKFDFVKLAPILIIHLNRFADTDGALAKKDTPVIFPITNFNLESFLADDSCINNTLNDASYCNYNLYALSSHTGNMISGHYTAFCKNSTLNKWYKYDDQTVSEVNELAIRALSSSAYLLFYSSLHFDSCTYI